MPHLARLLHRWPSIFTLTGLVVLIAPTRMANAQVPRLSAGQALQTPALTPPLTTSCQPNWLSTFGGQPGTNHAINASVVYDDGSGPALYIGGSFTNAGSIAASGIAKWNGSSWSPLGSGINGYVYALTVFDDGSGPALYAGGNFTNAGGVAANDIARWNGSGWSALGSGLTGAYNSVAALTVFNDGSGPALYAGGSFTTAGGVTANYIAKWNGSTWSALGSGTMTNGMDYPYISALTVFDDGSGRALYAGGGFTYVGGVAAQHIAKWNGSSWFALGSGTGGGIGAGVVVCLTVFDDGSGPALIAGGSFTTAGGVAANYIAKWNGLSWSALGSGLDNYVNALTVFNDGGGPALYAGGIFTTAGGVAANRIAKWNGSSWSALGSGMSGGSGGGGVVCLTAFDDGSGPALIAGGYFMTAGGAVVNHLAKWNGSMWSAFGRGMDNDVRALQVFDDGSGPALYAGGNFTIAGGVVVNHIARWNGTSWSPLGSGMNSWVGALTVFDDGGGPALYAGGIFTTAGGAAANYIAKWNGSSWSQLGSGMNNPVNALTVFDDGSGPALYAGGYFTTAGGVAANHIARWNGSSWSPLGGGLNSYVSALTVFDDGSGSALYAGGTFMTAGGVTVNNIAKWNGSSWSNLGSGMHGLASSNVWALTVFDDGSGAALYAGGVFTLAGSVAAKRIAKWNGSSWSALGNGMSGLSFPLTTSVNVLASFDDGSGPGLFAGGQFTVAGGVAANYTARWDGSSWSALGGGMNGSVAALAVFDDGRGSALYAGGSFSSALDSRDSYLAKWGNSNGCGIPGVSICEPGVGGVIACPCGNAPVGSGLGCDNSSNTGGAQLTATGIARLTYDTVVFTTTDEKPTATSIVLQGSSLSATGVVFGQGVGCVASNLKRMYVKTASGGSMSVPHHTDLHVHVRSAALGDVIAPGTHRYYGVYYRDPIVLGGCSASSTFNITQQLDVLWSP